MESILGRIVATVFGLLALGGVVLLMATATDSSRISQTGQDLGVLVTNTRAQFQQSQTLYANFTNANAAVLVQSNVIPSDMWRSGAIVDQWNDPVTISATTPTGMATNSAFQIQLGGPNLSAASCTKLVTSLTGYTSLTVNSVVFNQSNLPDPTVAGSACSTSTNITIVYQ